MGELVQRVLDCCLAYLAGSKVRIQCELEQQTIHLTVVAVERTLDQASLQDAEPEWLELEQSTRDRGGALTIESVSDGSAVRLQVPLH